MRWNRRLAAAFGFDRCYAVCGQTYPRKLDSRILAALSSVAQSAHRFATDIRLLQHDRQVEEPFGESQIGSSAMAYKRNPMRSERICSLARLVMAGAMNAPMTASVQWFERTLDDSANRRVSLPEAFLACDAALRAMAEVAGGLRVNERIVARAVADYLPFLATENLLMEGVRRGGDRQALHEIIRRHSMAATERMKAGEPCDLLERLADDPAFPLDGGADPRPARPGGVHRPRGPSRRRRSSPRSTLTRRGGGFAAAADGIGGRAAGARRTDGQEGGMVPCGI